MASEQSDQKLVVTLSKEYAQAFVSNDVGRVLSCLTEDFVSIAPDKPPVAGKKDTKAAIENDFANMSVLALQFDLDEVFIKGDWGFARGHSSGTIKMKGDGKIIQLKGKFLWILRKEAHGSWKVARDSAFGDEQSK
jgi:ketosteroid isomerase-like protein